MNYRHGDVFLLRVEALPANAQLEKRSGDIILAEGEATGHAHRIAAPTVVTWDANGQRYVQVPGGPDEVLDHEEHGRLDLEPGIYQVIHQVEYDYSAQAMRRVND